MRRWCLGIREVQNPCHFIYNFRFTKLSLVAKLCMESAQKWRYKSFYIMVLYQVAWIIVKEVPILRYLSNMTILLMLPLYTSWTSFPKRFFKSIIRYFKDILICIALLFYMLRTIKSYKIYQNNIYQTYNKGHVLVRDVVV